MTRRVRLATGLVLFLFVSTHLLNHALGLVSLRAAEQARLLFLAFWRNGPATLVFYGALLVHVGLALSALYERHTLRMPPVEAVRLVVGLCIPLLLAAHFAGSRMAHELYGVDDLYARVVPAIWNSGNALRQLTLLVLAWLHGCLGIHLVVRHRRGYREWFHLSFAAMLLLPLLAMLGFVNMAREVEVLQASGAIAATPSAADGEHLRFVSNWILLAFLALVAGALLLRAGRLQRERRLGRLVRLAYPDRTVDVPLGWSVLEASRAHGIAHLSLCGGRARCSTCRIRVAGDPAALPAPQEAELRTLRRVRAAPDVRLACQLRPTGDISVTPLLGARSSTETSGLGSEREVVVLFVDLRSWTSLSERHLPHDLAYVLDQFFEVIGDAVRSAGGVPNQFIGDSVMALFGLEQDVPTACRQAIAATRAIEAGMQRQQARMLHEFGSSLEFGMGLHVGPAAVGEVGWRETRTFSAVGDTVNTAARLQELCKAYAVRLVASEPVLQAAGLQVDRGMRREVDVRGRTEPLSVYAIASPGELPAMATKS